MAVRLHNTVQTYAWGDPSAIWELIGREPAGPGAELWMGAHPVAPSRVASPVATTLDELIGQDPPAALGADVAQRHGGRLPFLAKVLAAAQPLSLQAHPGPERARSGFEREEAEGRPLDDPARTYRDASHKPELICAITPFRACCGFRDLSATRALFDELATPALDDLRDRLRRDALPADVLADALRWLLTLPPESARRLVAATVDATAAPGSSHFRAEREWAGRMAEHHPGDAGVVVALLLNLVELAPGEALFLGAGNLHCYLEGVGVEVMASSDNVIRGGLTGKHVDVEELLDVVDASPLEVDVQRPLGALHTYRSPVPEFALTRIELRGPAVERDAGPHIVVALEGELELWAGDRSLELARGESAWVPAADGPLRLQGSGLVFDVTLGTG